MLSPTPDAMSREEIRAGASLASIFALRTLGLFLILPVFAVHAHGVFKKTKEELPPLGKDCKPADGGYGAASPT